VYPEPPDPTTNPRATSRPKYGVLVSLGAPPIVHDVLRGPGRALDPGVRGEMEARFEHDFSRVRVHNDAAAAASAKSVAARAYTVGSHVVFGEDRYAPGTPAGSELLAHELTHVVQQRSGPVDGTPAPGGINLSSPSDRFEQAAEQTATAVMSGNSVAADAESEEPVQRVVQRDAAEEGEEEESEPGA
jgi:hypothetical protein